MRSRPRRTGWCGAIDNLQIARIARLAGAPLAKGAGVDLFRKQGDAVRQGEALYAIHAEFPADYPLRSRPGGPGQRLPHRRAVNSQGHGGDGAFPNGVNGMNN